MSTLKVNNLQVGQDATATNNFTLYQPAVPDGTVRLGVGNSGSVGDLLTVNGTAARLQINTSTGTTGLKIVGLDTNGYSDLDINSVGTIGYSRLFFSDTAGQSGSIIYAHGTNSLQFKTGGSVSATLGGDGLIVGDFTPIDARNAGGVQVAHSKGISFRSNTSQSVSRNWRIRNDDWGWGNLDFGVGDSVSDVSDSASDTVLSLTSSRNVGIGTTNPNSKLDVAGSITVYGATGGYNSITDNAYLRFGTLNSTGSTFLGYGVRSKTVSEGAGVNELVSTTSIGLGRAAIIVGSLGGGASGTFQVWTGPGESGVADGGTLANFQQRLTVNDSGNVGIGTTNPVAKLHIFNSALDSTLLYLQGNNNYNYEFRTKTGPSVGGQRLDSFIGSSGAEWSFTDGDNVERLRIKSSGEEGLYVRKGIEVSNHTSVSLLLSRNNAEVTKQHFYVHSNNSPWYLYGENLTWTGERSGTTRRANKPYYEGFAPVVGRREFGFVNKTTADTSFISTDLVSSLTLLNDGNVGIGTTNPIVTLDVFGPIRSSRSAYPKLSLYNTSITKEWLIEGISSNLGITEAGVNTHLTVAAGGNVGIGTTNPAGKLDVRGGVIYNYTTDNTNGLQSGYNTGVVATGQTNNANVASNSPFIAYASSPSSGRSSYRGKFDLTVFGNGTSSAMPVQFTKFGYSGTESSLGGEFHGWIRITSPGSSNPTDYNYSGYNNWATMTFQARFDLAHWNAKPSMFAIEHYAPYAMANIFDIFVSGTQSMFVIYLLPNLYTVEYEVCQGLTAHWRNDNNVGGAIDIRESNTISTFNPLAHASRDTRYDSTIMWGGNLAV